MADIAKFIEEIKKLEENNFEINFNEIPKSILRKTKKIKRYY